MPLFANCAQPTQFTVSVASEVPCKSNARVVLIGAKSLAALASSAPSASSTRCVDDGGLSRMGEIVLVPQGAKDQAIAFAFATRPDGQAADTCLEPAQAAGCIVARRQLRFVPHESTSLGVPLRLSCLGVTCPDDQTCAKGRCVEATVTCADGVCEPPPGEENVDGSIRNGEPDGATVATSVDAAGDQATSFPPQDAASDRASSVDAGLGGSCAPFSVRCDVGCTLAPPDAQLGTDCIAMCKENGRGFEFANACGPTQVCKTLGDTVCVENPK